MCRCGCFCISGPGVCKRNLVQIETADSADEREQLQEPLDQISLSSVDSLEPDEDSETKSIAL